MTDLLFTELWSLEDRSSWTEEERRVAEQAFLAGTCLCGMWPLEEYGGICPSCVPQAKIDDLIGPRSVDAAARAGIVRKYRKPWSS